MHIVLTRSPGTRPWAAAYDLDGPAALRAWLGSIRRVGKTYVAVDFGDGLLRQAFTRRGHRVIPITAPTGRFHREPRADPRMCDTIWAAVCETITDETSRSNIDQTRGATEAPRYRSNAEADADGWVTWPRSVPYRGYLIIPEYTTASGLRARIRKTAGVADARGHIRFRWLRAPTTPKTQSVTVDHQLNKFGDRYTLLRLVRRAEYETYLDECREVIDVAVDGRRDIDIELIER